MSIVNISVDTEQEELSVTIDDEPVEGVKDIRASRFTFLRGDEEKQEVVLEMVADNGKVGDKLRKVTRIVTTASSIGKKALAKNKGKFIDAAKTLLRFTESSLYQAALDRWLDDGGTHTDDEEEEKRKNKRRQKGKPSKNR